ncbi:FecR family protein [Proteiniphilum sp. UBA5384]|uniref:FecR family protein n=1 Tax=Proteiniphilum sp. UBA5384 TaxID=1947279 RepID=UPI0025ECF6A0|nr:FecR family protein [Proteiniphilum sp. UBA5384]
MGNYFNKIIDLFVKTDVSADFQAEFQKWLTAEKFSEEKDSALKSLWQKTEEGNFAGISSQTQQSLGEVHKKIKQRQRKVNIRFLHFWQVSAACLTIALLSTLYFAINKKSVNADLIEQYTPIAEITHLTLPDGTQVQLNSTATLFYPEQFTGETRSVYLIGEANFKVSKNKKQPFIVKSNDLQVTALGTEFNMQVYPGNPILSTTLLSGSVEVRFNNMTTTHILKPNEQLIYNKQTKEDAINYPDIGDITAWQRGELVFKSVTLKEIFTVLERKYPYTFVYALNSLKDDKYMFRFKEKTSLEEVMDIIIGVAGNIRYSIEGDKCYISPL